jgi:hypothetical protein
MPGTTSCYATAQWWTQERDATLVALALTLFHRRHGAWPERLEQLVPDLLPTVPPDRFTGQPLRYRVVEGRPVLYSVGPDIEDQGGQGPDLPAGELESLYRSSIYRRSSHPGAVPEKSDVGWDWVFWRSFRAFAALTIESFASNLGRGTLDAAGRPNDDRVSFHCSAASHADRRSSLAWSRKDRACSSPS